MNHGDLLVVVDWWRIGLKHHQATTQGGYSTMRECSRLNCLFGQDLRVVLAPFGSDPVRVQGVRSGSRFKERRHIAKLGR